MLERRGRCRGCEGFESIVGTRILTSISILATISLLVTLYILWWLSAVGEVAEKRDEPAMVSILPGSRYSSAPGGDSRELVKGPN